MHSASMFFYCTSFIIILTLSLHAVMFSFPSVLLFSSLYCCLHGLLVSHVNCLLPWFLFDRVLPCKVIDCYTFLCWGPAWCVTVRTLISSEVCTACYMQPWLSNIERIAGHHLQPARNFCEFVFLNCHLKCLLLTLSSCSYSFNRLKFSWQQITCFMTQPVVETQNHIRHCCLTFASPSCVLACFKIEI